MSGAGRAAGLRAALEAALEDAAVGEPSSAALEGRLRTVARAVLLRHGLGQSRVEVRRQGAGLAVRVILPPGTARVRELVVTLGATPW